MLPGYNRLLLPAQEPLEWFTTSALLHPSRATSVAVLRSEEKTHPSKMQISKASKIVTFRLFWSSWTLWEEGEEWWDWACPKYADLHSPDRETKGRRRRPPSSSEGLLVKRKGEVSQGMLKMSVIKMYTLTMAQYYEARDTKGWNCVGWEHKRDTCRETEPQSCCRLIYDSRKGQLSFILLYIINVLILLAPAAGF